MSNLYSSGGDRANSFKKPKNMIKLSLIFNVSFPSVRHPEFSIPTLAPVCAPRKPPVPAISFGHQQDAPVNAL